MQNEQHKKSSTLDSAPCGENETSREETSENDPSTQQVDPKPTRGPGSGVPWRELKPMSQAERIIHKFGGAGRMSRLFKQVDPETKIHRCTIYRWTYPRSRRGTNGFIPNKAWPLVRKAAALDGIVLTDQDVYPGILESRDWDDELSAHDRPVLERPGMPGVEDIRSKKFVDPRFENPDKPKRRRMRRSPAQVQADRSLDAQLRAKWAEAAKAIPNEKTNETPRINKPRPIK